MCATRYRTDGTALAANTGQSGATDAPPRQNGDDLRVEVSDVTGTQQR